MCVFLNMCTSIYNMLWRFTQISCARLTKRQIRRRSLPFVRDTMHTHAECISRLQSHSHRHVVCVVNASYRITSHRINSIQFNSFQFVSVLWCCMVQRCIYYYCYYMYVIGDIPLNMHIDFVYEKYCHVKKKKKKKKYHDLRIIR